MEFNKPSILSLDGNVAENFKTFKEEVLVYFAATESNKKPIQVQVARLKNLLGPEAQKLYRNLTCNDGSEETVLSILNVLEEHCLPQKNEIIDIFNFFTRKQHQNEPFDKFYADLKHLIKPCGFEEQEKKLLRAQIVLGIRSKSVKERLLREDISIEKTIAICKSAEATDTNLRIIEERNFEKQNDLNEIGTSPENDSEAGFGHVNIVSKRIQPHPGNSYSKYQSKVESYSYNRIKCTKCVYFHDKRTCPASDDVRSWNEIIRVEGVNVKFKLDSGAEVNILPLSFVKENSLNPKLEKCCVKLQAFGGFTIEPVGKLTCLVESKTRITDVEFLIVKNCKTPIIGLSTCIKLNLLKRVELLQSSNGKDEIYSNNKEVFDGVGCFPDTCTIKLSHSAEPKICPARRIPLKVREKFKETLDDLVKKGIIIPVNEPVEWVNNVVIVEKPNGSLRICIDPKELNKYIIMEKYTIPTLEELAPALSNKKLYTVLDIKDGFYHVKLNTESSKLCSFSTIYGTYRFLRAPFGLSCMPEIFQRLVYKYFGDIPGVSIYFDDLCIAGNSKQEIDGILKKVFERAKKYNIKFNINKLQYCVDEVKYLGVIFNKDGMSPDPNKISSIKSLANPTNKTELQQILGLVSYLRNFIPNLAELTAPFRELLKKNIKWQWTESHTKSFETLKEIICSHRVLAAFDEKLPIDIQCDASNDAIGCCILQNGKPVSFASRCLSSAETQYAQIEKELLAITFACNRFHYYIYGQQNVTIHTDHMPLLSIMNKNMNNIKNNRLRRLKLKLIDYTFTLKYLSGKKMYIADLLSRNIIRKFQPDDETMKDYIHTLCLCELSISDEKLKELQTATESDVSLKNVLKWYLSGWPVKCPEQGEIKHYFNLKNEILSENGLLYYQNRLIVPLKFRKYILQLLHETHNGIVKTKLNARNYFYWPGMMADIESYISGCSVCLKYSRSNSQDSLIPHEIPQLPFNKVGLDIAEYGGKNYLILVDYFSKWLEVIKLNTKSSSEIISKLKDVFSHSGIPETIIADNMPFNSYEFQCFANSWNFKIHTSSPYHPKSNGLAEKGVGIAKSMLKKAQEEKKDIQLYLLNYRNTPLPGLNVSPAQLLMNRNLRSKLPVKSQHLKPAIVNSEVYERIIQNQDKQKLYYDHRTRRSEDTFQEGENVWVQNVKSSVWEKGTIVKKLHHPRSYLVKIDKENNIIRRNNIHLKKVKLDKKFKYYENQEHREEEGLSSSPANKAVRKSTRPKKTTNKLNL